MDAYPPDYVLHNLPLVVLSGLDANHELDPVIPTQEVLPGRAITSINSEIPSLTGAPAQQLLQEFLSYDGRSAPWNGRPGSRKGNVIGFRLRTAGRDFILPPRKADPPLDDDVPPPETPARSPSTPSWILHSPISPLSPQSSTYPDGVIGPSWVAKHQYYVPSVFISLFEFNSDPTTNTLYDNQLKTEINRIKGDIQRSGYRTRYAVVLLSEKTIIEAPDIEERLSGIRRATGLDPKNSLFFLPSKASQVEIRSFVHTVLTALQPVCIEYYRDLTKHARRKKGRGSIPPPTAPPTRGTSQTLSHQGWGVRYEFKLGVFAEFRQEMDAAQRHYSFALESLFGPDGVFETTASWSPRWDEIRLLADTIALRYIRCLLWNNMTTSAVQAWQTFRFRLQDLIDRRGKGTANYGWEAWESRWAQIMAELIKRADLPIFKVTKSLSDSDSPNDVVVAMFSTPERAIPVGERLAPWQHIHHPGYWYKLSAEHARRRMRLAKEIPEEDRTPPGMSPATQVSHRNQIYDHYLVPETHLENPLPGSGEGFNHYQDIVGKLASALSEFNIRLQGRMCEQLELEAARIMLQAEMYREAYTALRALWEKMTWRKEGWWNLASEVTWYLHDCAFRIQDAEAYVATEWELYSKVFSPKRQYRHDLMACLKSFPLNEGPKPIISLDAESVVNYLSVSFTFSEPEGNVGEPLQTQIAVTSAARPDAAPVVISDLILSLKGCLEEIRLSHQPVESAHTTKELSCLFDVASQETVSSEHKARWTMTGDLTLHSGQTKVFTTPITFRDAGDLEVSACKLLICADRFDLQCENLNIDDGGEPIWWIRGGSKLKPRMLNRQSGTVIKVLPKPPKMEIRVPNQLEHYYTDESVTLDIEIYNKEEEDTEAVLEVRLLGRSKDTLSFSWTDDAASTAPLSTEAEQLQPDMDLPGHVVGQLTKGETSTQTIRFKAPAEPSDYALEVKVLYHLLSDRDIPISKTFISDLIFVGPFEASFELIPRVHTDPWPSYFELQEDNDDVSSAGAFGIAQRWQLKAKIGSFADEPIVVQDLALDVHNIQGGASGITTKEFEVKDLILNSQELEERSFGMETRKANLEERRPIAINMDLHITWRRSADGSPSVLTKVPIPRLLIPSSEPRVLATAVMSETVSFLIHLDYTIENPTMHFLTFELNMEASEEFGFSGPKLRVLHILPMSRQTVRYNILPLVRGTWLTAQLRVLDRYFNKTLKVLATPGIRLDKKGVSIWVDAEEDDGES